MLDASGEDLDGVMTMRPRGLQVVAICALMLLGIDAGRKAIAQQT
jgi:hypothetical protein